MKKITAFFLALLMILSLSACGTGASDDQPEQTQGSNETDGTAAPPAYEGQLKDLLPETSLFNLSSGTFHEEKTYGYYLITGAAWECQDYSVELTQLGFYSEGWSCLPVPGDSFDLSYYHPDLLEGATVYVRMTYYDGTLLLMAGTELPVMREYMTLMGIPEEYIPAPSLDGDVYDYIPDHQGVIDLYYTETHYQNGQYWYQLCDVDRTRLDQYIAIITDAGYVETTRDEPDGESMYYEARLKADEKSDIYVTVQIAWYQNKVMLVYSVEADAMDKEAVWEGARSYTGDKTGRDPNAVPEGGYPVIDLSGAAASEWKGYPVQTLEGVQYIESVAAYIGTLKEQGYVEACYLAEGYYLDHITNNEAMLASLCNEATSDYVFVGYYNGKLMVIHSDDIITIPESELCDELGCVYQPGENFLRYHVNQLFYGPGRGYSTSGVAYNYCDGQGAGDFRNAVQTVIRAGYTNIYIDEENEFCAYRDLNTLNGVYSVYAHVFLVADHLEVQIALTYETEVMGLD